MNDQHATIDVVKEHLNAQLFEVFSDSDILVDYSDELNDLLHMVIFASQKYSKKAKMPVECRYSADTNLNIEESTSIYAEFLLRMAIENDPNGIKYGKLRSLCRKIFSITKSFCNQYKLTLVLVPFEVVYSEEADDFVVTQVPKFEHLRFHNHGNNKKYKNLDEFYSSQVKLLNSAIDMINTSEYWSSIGTKSEDSTCSSDSSSASISDTTENT